MAPVFIPRGERIFLRASMTGRTLRKDSGARERKNRRCYPYASALNGFDMCLVYRSRVAPVRDKIPRHPDFGAAPMISIVLAITLESVTSAYIAHSAA